MLVDKAKVKRYYQELVNDFPDLCHVYPEYTELWVRKAKNLQLVGAWFHYMLLIRKAKDYIKQNCPCYLNRFNKILKGDSHG